MKYCRHCGKEMADEAVICTGCGVPVEEKLYKPATTDSGGFGWGILGFFFPLVGLILFLIWRDEKPITAKALGIGALVGVILSVVISIICIVIAAATFPYYMYNSILFNILI